MFNWLKTSDSEDKISKIITHSNNMSIIKGDLIGLAIEGNFDAIIHGCNCFCTMGAGIAKQIKDKFPQAYLADLITKEGDLGKLGKFTQTVHKGKNNKIFFIINAYTQYDPGPNFDEESFIEICQTLNEMFKDKTIGMPWIGCGIGGGNKEKVTEIIYEYLKDCKVIIVEYNGKQ